MVRLPFHHSQNVNASANHGPGIDMGTYKMSSFSKSQQEPRDVLAIASAGGLRRSVFGFRPLRMVFLFLLEVEAAPPINNPGAYQSWLNVDRTHNNGY